MNTLIIFFLVIIMSSKKIVGTGRTNGRNSAYSYIVLLSSIKSFKNNSIKNEHIMCKAAIKLGIKGVVNLNIFFNSIN